MNRPVVKLPVSTVDERFRALGTQVRLIIKGSGASVAAARGRAAVLDYHDRLSRFCPASELSALNRDERHVVPASPLLRSAVASALWAARYSGGLVDPCLLAALERAGYARSHQSDGQLRIPTGRPRSAAPHPHARWRELRIDDELATVNRPPGLRLDLGGTGKGHVADLIAADLSHLGEWVVNCGGDIRVGGRWTVEVDHPLRDQPAARLAVEDAAIATSSVVSRTWTTAEGHDAHHLLDPRTGEPAWTGLLSASALAPTTLQAETLAKVALLSGPAAARRVLTSRGGVLIHADGCVETIGAPQLGVAA